MTWVPHGPLSAGQSKIIGSDLQRGRGEAGTARDLKT